MVVRTAVPNEKTSEITILARFINADKKSLSQTVAQYLPTLGFDQDDQDRMSDHAEQNQKGPLGHDEVEELQNFVKTGHMLALPALEGLDASP